MEPALEPQDPDPSVPLPNAPDSPQNDLPEPTAVAQSINPASPQSAEAYDSLSFGVDLMAARARRKRRARGEPEPPRRLADRKADRADTSGRQLQDYLTAALAEEPKEEAKRGLTEVFTESVRSLDLKSRSHRCLHCLRGCPTRTAEWTRRRAADVDESVHRWKTSRLGRRVQDELVRMAVEAGDLPPSALPGRCSRGLVSDEDIEKLRFSPPYVVEAFRSIRPRPKKAFMERVLDGEIPLDETLCVLISFTLLVTLVVLFLYLGLASAVFSAKDVAADAIQGTIVDASTGLTTVGAAATVALKPLWNYPSLSLDELRRVEDVLFVHNQATHVLRVATVSRMASGTVLLKAVDSSTVRVEPSGRSFWQRVGHPEVFLEAMESWRTAPGNAEVDWLTSGVLATQVTVPM